MNYAESYQEEQEAFCLFMHGNQDWIVPCKLYVSQARTTRLNGGK